MMTTKNSASYRFVDVPPYKDESGAPRADPLEYRIDEENDRHMTITFYVSSEEVRHYVTRWWKQVFRDCPAVAYYPSE